MIRFNLQIITKNNHILFIYKDNEQRDENLKKIEILVPKDDLVIKKEQNNLIIGNKNITYTYFTSEDKYQVNEWWEEIINIIT